MTEAAYRRCFTASFLATIMIFLALAGFVYINDKAESVLSAPKENTAISEAAPNDGEEMHYSLEFALGLGDIIRGFSPYLALVIGVFVLICDGISNAVPMLSIQHF